MGVKMVISYLVSTYVCKINRRDQVREQGRRQTDNPTKNTRGYLGMLLPSQRKDGWRETVAMHARVLPAVVAVVLTKISVM